MGNSVPPSPTSVSPDATTRRAAAPPAISFGEAFRVWLRIGLLSFGGPAGQIALMHRVLVDEKTGEPKPEDLSTMKRYLELRKKAKQRIDEDITAYKNAQAAREGAME